MGTKANQIYLVGIRVEPYEQEISVDVTFHVTGVVTCEWVGTVFFRNRLFISQQLKDFE